MGELKINTPTNFDILNGNLKDWLDDEFDKKMQYISNTIYEKSIEFEILQKLLMMFAQGI